jgi:hypothetical protein
MEQGQAFSLLAESQLEIVPIQRQPHRWSCQHCGLRVRRWRIPPDGWAAVGAVRDDGFLGYHCPACAERKAVWLAKYRNMAAVRTYSESKR